MMRLGWIGLGSMGRPMALSALRCGHLLSGYARRPEEHGAIRQAGGVVTSVLRDAVAEAEMVCVNLFSEQQIQEVVVDGGAIRAMPSGSILALHSTVSPAFVRSLATIRRDIALLDAGFSGSPEDAAAGRLTLMVGGDAKVLERARAVFTAYAAEPIAHAGQLGCGMALKVINNLMFAAHIAIARDALALVEANGLVRDIAVRTLLRGSGGSART